MRLSSSLICLLLFVVPKCTLTKEDELDPNSCNTLYQKGVDAYLENRFQECVINLEEALQKYRSYTKALQNCRLKCSQEAELSDPLYPLDIEHLHFYEKTVKNTLCIVKCRQFHKSILGAFTLNPETEKVFEDRKPYEYLHSCYFQIQQYQKAASAAFTYLVAHPKDEIIIKTLNYYSTQPDVDMKEVINFDANDYVYLYIHGVDEYEKKDWRGAQENMEESLLSYLQSEEECRAQCEGPFDQGWYPDFIPNIANHFTYCLKCKRKCREKLNNLNGEHLDDLLPSHYHYLQFAYFKSGNLKAACQAAASYVLFYPDDETMRSNIEYYKKLPKVEDSYFTPRVEAVDYVRRYTYEGRLLKFIQAEFNFNDTTSNLIKEMSSEEKLDKTENYLPNIQLIMDENDLNGTKRFVSDGLASESECKSLLEVAKLYARPGDGYNGNKSPHTKMEIFEGLTLGRAALLVYLGLMDSKSLKLYLKITEHARQHLTERFNLAKKLYFTYTHLVCRTALSHATLKRTDFSHSVHADNCNLVGDGFCQKLPPAYTWRDYSAIVYLNSNFQGGQFIFAEDFMGNIIQSSVKPKCGRMVGFSSGFENLHGVLAVKQGTRCAVALWFTFDRNHSENDRNIAYQLVNQERNFDFVNYETSTVQSTYVNI